MGVESSQPIAKHGRMNLQSLGLMGVALLAILLTGLVLVTVSSTLPPPSDFVSLPDTPMSKSGLGVTFTNISPLIMNGVAVGVSGNLVAGSGNPVAGATVYMTYYFQGSYRTEMATTDQNGYFSEHFPMNWTGSLPLTLTYFGDNQYRGIRQVVTVEGENLAINLLQE